MNAIANLARRVRRPARAAIEAAPAIAAPLSAPTFTPSARTLGTTAPFRIPAGRHTTPGLSRPIPHRPPADDGTPPRALGGMAAIPADAPDPGLSRGSRFTRDARKPRGGGLPVFRSVGRDLGWAGLNEEHPAATLPPADWGIAEQANDLLHVIAAGAKTARIDVSGTLEALVRQAAAERDRRGTRAATGLGYPDGAA